MAVAGDSEAFVEFRDVSKSYDGREMTVKNFNLQVARGDFVTLLGPSGSGKTTCLKMLAGFESLSAGRVFLNGQPIDATPAHKRNIGVVFQHYALFPHMTVAENLAFPLQVRRVSRPLREAAVKEALEMVRLEGLAKRRPAQLSGGQQQRVAIARALVFKPDIILMDEPLGALDRRLREEMQYEIRRLQQELKVTVLYVTHDQNEAMALSDWVAVMNDGQIQQIAHPEVLYEEPEKLFVANFIGENNQINGRVLNRLPGVATVRVANGEVVKALPVTVEEGDKLTSLSVRPERVAINPDPESYPNLFNAVVEDIIFLGDHLRVYLRLFGDQIFIAKIPNVIGHGALLPKDKVKVGWLVTDCRALDVDPNWEHS